MAEKDSLMDRMLRAAMLDADLYDKLMADTSANRQALAAVAVTSLISGFGVGFAAVIAEGGLGFFGGVLVGFIASLVVCYLIFR